MFLVHNQTCRSVRAARLACVMFPKVRWHRGHTSGRDATVSPLLAAYTHIWMSWLHDAVWDQSRPASL